MEGEFAEEGSVERADVGGGGHLGDAIGIWQRGNGWSVVERLLYKKNGWRAEESVPVVPTVDVGEKTELCLLAISYRKKKKKKNKMAALYTSPVPSLLISTPRLCRSCLLRSQSLRLKQSVVAGIATKTKTKTKAKNQNQNKKDVVRLSTSRHSPSPKRPPRQLKRHEDDSRTLSSARLRPPRQRPLPSRLSPPAASSSEAVASPRLARSPPPPPPAAPSSPPESTPPSTAPLRPFNLEPHLSYHWDTTPPSAPQLTDANAFFLRHPPTFLSSDSKFRTLAVASAPEVAFLGRSNVGKSTLLNAVLGRKLCHTSGKPGRTRTMNAVGVHGGRLVVLDMPGHGHGSREEWGREILKYLGKRKA